jgi:hypothetical protein
MSKEDQLSYYKSLNDSSNKYGIWVKNYRTKVMEFCPCIHEIVKREVMINMWQRRKAKRDILKNPDKYKQLCDIVKEQYTFQEVEWRFF